jgi:hypothetical protein
MVRGGLRSKRSKRSKRSASDTKKDPAEAGPVCASCVRKGGNLRGVKRDERLSIKLRRQTETTYQMSRDVTF